VTASVTVIIPTRNRPTLVVRAVESVLGQTFDDFDVIVVVDGQDEATVGALSRIADSRLHLEVLDQGVGGAQARNLGVLKAQTEWIAFLDDDDEWLPSKLEKQMKLARNASGENVCIVCQFIEQSENGERILPLRFPDPGEPISEYIYCPKGFSTAEGFVQTSTLLVRRSALVKTPFLPGLACGQETTWLLRSSKDTNLKLLFVPEPLVIFNDRRTRTRVSIAPKWRTVYDWARQNPEYFTAKAYSFFIPVGCVPYALSCNEPAGVFLELLRECFHGKPTIKCLFIFFYRWLVPTGLRRRSGWILGRGVKALKGQPA
jgi:glycosyltransferase involved in cell wall biosynthesis